MALIEVKGLGKTYCDGSITEALKNVSFGIEENEFVAIMGPSGSGKSTLLHILGFLDKPTKGEYLFDGKNIENYSKEDIARFRNRKLGFVFQMFNLLPRTTVFENVALPLVYSDISVSERKEIVNHAIEAVGLNHRTQHETSQLSGGEQQRVAIARAIINNPQVVFADEPTGNLDSKSGGQIMELIESLHAKGHTVILITHETYTAEYAQRIIKLKDGMIESDKRVDNRHTIRDHHFFK